MLNSKYVGIKKAVKKCSINSTSSLAPVKTLEATSIYQKDDIYKFLNSFLKCRIFDPTHDKKYGENITHTNEKVEFDNDTFEIPRPIDYNIKNVTCQLCKKNVNPNYLIRREHVIREHADIIADNIIRKTPSKLANFIVTVFVVIKEAFPNNAVYSDIQCIICGKFIKTILGMQEHTSTSHNIAPFKCPFQDCHFTTCYKRDIVKHSSIVHKKSLNVHNGINYVDLETEIVKKFSIKRKTFIINIVDKFFPVNIKWYENELKGNDGHVYSIFDNLNKLWLNINNNTTNDFSREEICTFESDIQLVKKINEKTRSSIKEKPKLSNTTILNNTKCIDKNLNNEIFPSNLNKKNQRISRDKPKQSNSQMNLNNTKNRIISRCERKKSNITDHDYSKSNMLEKSGIDHNNKSTNYNEKTSLTKPTKTNINLLNNSRKRSSAKSFYNPLCDATPIKKTHVDRYAKKKLHPKTDNDKNQCNEIVEEDKSEREIKPRNSPNSCIQKVCEPKKRDDREFLLETRIKFSRNREKSISNSVVIYNNSPDDNNYNQSRKSIGSGSKDSPIVIESDSGSEEEIVISNVLKNINSINRETLNEETLNEETLNKDGISSYEPLNVIVAKYSKDDYNTFKNPPISNNPKQSKIDNVFSGRVLNPLDPRSRSNKLK